MTSKQVTLPPWNSRKLVHSKEMVWAWRWSVALRAFYRQILSLLYTFFSSETSAPGSPGNYLYTYLINLCLFVLRIEHSYRNDVRIDSGVNLSDQRTRWQTYVRHHVAHGLLHSKRHVTSSIDIQRCIRFPCLLNWPLAIYGLDSHPTPRYIWPSPFPRRVGWEQGSLH